MIEKENNWEFLEDTKEKYLKLHDKTNTINDETDKIKRHKHDFMNFCKYRWSLRKVRPGSIKINEDENGDKYLSIEVRPGDCPEFINNEKKEWLENNIKTERNELWLDEDNNFDFNKDFKYKFSFKIPENFPVSPTRLVIWQWKYNKIEGSNEESSPSPILAQRIKKINWKYFFVITDWTEKKSILWKIPFDDINGKWVDMDYEIRFSDKSDENGNQIPCNVKIKADVEWKRKIDEDKEFYLAEENTLQFNSKQSHTWYFKFGLYRNNYDYEKNEKTKIKDQEGLNELGQVQKAEEQNPMKIYFKNFYMKDLGYKEFEKEKQQSKNEQQSLVWKLIERFKHSN